MQKKQENDLRLFPDWTKEHNFEKLSKQLSKDWASLKIHFKGGWWNGHRSWVTMKKEVPTCDAAIYWCQLSLTGLLLESRQWGHHATNHWPTVNSNTKSCYYFCFKNVSSISQNKDNYIRTLLVYDYFLISSRNDMFKNLYPNLLAPN